MSSFLFHPPLVHFPIAFYFLEFLLLFLWVVRKKEDYRRFASFAFRLGYLFMMAALVAGLVDAGGFGNIQGKVRLHFLAAVAVSVFYTARALFWRWGKEDSPFYRPLQLASAVLGNGLVTLTAYWGGVLVFG